MEFIKAVRKFNFGPRRNLRNNDFFSDRLSNRHTVNILVVFIILATFRRLFSSPINCWVPAELRRYEKYMNRYCWLTGTYYVDYSYDLNELQIRARSETLLKYYQWVYFFLIFQAFLFYLPKLLWCFVTQKILEFDLFNMVDAAIKYETYSFDLNRIVKFLSANLIYTRNYLPVDRAKQAVKIHKKVEDIEKVEESMEDFPEPKLTYDISNFEFMKYRISKFLLTITYILIKILYIIIAVVQILLINYFLSTQKHNFYGAEVLERILSGQAELGQNTDSKVFPRITLCDVKTRELGTDHTYSIECVLSFNLFNERIYAFIWFWLVVVIIPFTVFDLVAWLIRLLKGSRYRYKFIKNRIKIYNKIIDKKEKYMIKLFTEYYIGADGVFVLRLLEHNSNSTVVADLINQMWIHFRLEQRK